MRTSPLASSTYLALEEAARLSRPRAGRYWATVVGLILGLNLYVALEAITMKERVLASLIILVAGLAIWWWLVARSKWGPDAPFIPLFAAIYAAYYALPIFTLKRYSVASFDPRQVDRSGVEKALLLAALSLTLTLLGFYFRPLRRLRRVLPKVRLDWRDYEVVKFTSIAFCLLGMIAFLIGFLLKVPIAVREYVGLAGDLYYIGILALFILQLERRLEWSLALLLWLVLIPVRIVLGTAQGYLFWSIEVVLALVMAYATMKRRIPWIVLGAGFATFIVIQPVKAEFRKKVWVGGGSNSNQSNLEKIQALIHAAEKGFLVAQALGTRRVVHLASARLANIIILAKVVDLTPSAIGYWGGETYYPFLSKPIPRILYPDKPEENFANSFGHRYAFIWPTDHTTSINLPQLVELYGSFGPLGVIIGSFLLGCVYRVIHDVFINPETGLGAIVGAVYVLAHMLLIECHLSLVLGALVEEVVLLFTVHLVITQGESLRRRVTLA